MAKKPKNITQKCWRCGGKVVTASAESGDAQVQALCINCQPTAKPEMSADEMKRKFIDLVHSRMQYGGNPYASDLRAELEHDGQVKVCEDIMDILGMSSEEIERAYKEQNGL